MDPYSICRFAGCMSAKFLFAAYQAALQAAALAKEFGASRTVFIPETGEVDARGLLIRSPESLRTLFATAMAKSSQRPRVRCCGDTLLNALTSCLICTCCCFLRTTFLHKPQLFLNVANSHTFSAEHTMDNHKKHLRYLLDRLAGWPSRVCSHWWQGWQGWNSS